jgi:hypothetical protein
MPNHRTKFRSRQKSAGGNYAMNAATAITCDQRRSGVAQRWALFALLCGPRLPRDGYNSGLVASSTLSGVGPLVLRHVPPVTGRRILFASEFARLARVVQERRAGHGFLFTAWGFLPDRWRALFYPRSPLTISRVMEAIKDGATKRTDRLRGGPGQSAAALF